MCYTKREKVETLMSILHNDMLRNKKEHWQRSDALLRCRLKSVLAPAKQQRLAHEIALEETSEEKR